LLLQSLSKNPTFLITLAGMAIALGLLIWPWPEGADVGLVRISAVILAAVVLYLTRAVPEHVTSFAFILAVVVFGLAPVEVAFSGFLTSAIWLVFGGLIISISLQYVDLDNRIGALADGIAHMRYPTIIFTMVFAGLAVGFFLPSTIGRILILIPLVLAFCTRIGLVEGRPGRMGIVLALALGTYYPTSAILPANTPIVALAGATETVYGLSITFGEYLLWQFPVLGIVKSILVSLVLIRFFPDQPSSSAQNAETPALLSGHQKLALFLFIMTLILWSTDTLHGIAPGYVSLLAATLILIPGLGLAPKDTLSNLDLSPVFHLVGVMAIGAVVAHSGLGKVAAQFLIDLANPTVGQDFLNFTILNLISNILSLVTTSLGNPAVFVPIAQDFATATGLPLKTVIMIGVIGLANPLFPYLAPPLVVTFVMIGLPVRTGLKLCFVLWIWTVILLWPLTFIYWRMMGLI
jgi:di/tricarboxylate transporter